MAFRGRCQLAPTGRPWKAILHPAVSLLFKSQSMASESGSIGGVVDAQQSSVQSQLLYSVLAKQLEAQRQAGQAATDLLAAALQLSKEAGKGESFDGVG